ncbi:hypothetical protein RvY_06027-2 [Ramazzottius varieornatus]|nr:hypothetical protein RvY_06027-2 [Ramazzottius varieornatus]
MLKSITKSYACASLFAFSPIFHRVQRTLNVIKRTSYEPGLAENLRVRTVRACSLGLRVSASYFYGFSQHYASTLHTEHRFHQACDPFVCSQLCLLPLKASERHIQVSCMARTSCAHVELPSY